MPRDELLGPWVRRFLLDHIVGERNFSRNTQRSYRDTLAMLLPFIATQAGKPLDRLEVVTLSASRVRLFLAFLQQKRGTSVATRNQRLAAIRSLARFIAEHSPEHVAWYGDIKTVPFKKTIRNLISYLEKSEVEALLAVPDCTTREGQRNHTLLLFLYNSGARASEAAGLCIGDLDFTTTVTPSVRILGKGMKERRCPLWRKTAAELAQLVGGRSQRERVFLNRHGQPLTRFGIYNLLKVCVERAGKGTPSLLTKRVSHRDTGSILKDRKAGTVMHVCTDEKCKTHRQFSHYEISPQEREQRRKLAFAVRVQKESRSRILQAARQKLPCALARADFEMVALDYLRRLGQDKHHRLFQVYGWEEKKTKTSWGGNSVDHEKLAQGRVRTMTAADLNRFMVTCALIADLYCPGYSSAEVLSKETNLMRTAVRYKVDAIPSSPSRSMDSWSRMRPTPNRHQKLLLHGCALGTPTPTRRCRWSFLGVYLVSIFEEHQAGLPVRDRRNGKQAKACVFSMVWGFHGFSMG